MTASSWLLVDAHDEPDRAEDRSRPSRGRRPIAADPPAIADAPSPTSAGVFGIARTTATPARTGRAPARCAAIVTPAAIDRSRARPAATAVAAAAATSPGLTASTAARHAGRSGGDRRRRGTSTLSCSRRAASASMIATIDGSVDLGGEQPPSSAAPMLPPPTTASSNTPVRPVIWAIVHGTGADEERFVRAAATEVPTSPIRRRPGHFPWVSRDREIGRKIERDQRVPTGAREVPTDRAHSGAWGRALTGAGSPDGSRSSGAGSGPLEARGRHRRSVCRRPPARWRSRAPQSRKKRGKPIRSKGWKHCSTVA